MGHGGAADSPSHLANWTYGPAGGSVEAQPTADPPFVSSHTTGPALHLRNDGKTRPVRVVPEEPAEIVAFTGEVSRGDAPGSCAGDPRFQLAADRMRIPCVDDPGARTASGAGRQALEGPLGTAVRSRRRAARNALPIARLRPPWECPAPRTVNRIPSPFARRTMRDASPPLAGVTTAPAVLPAVPEAWARAARWSGVLSTPALDHVRSSAGACRAARSECRVEAPGAPVQGHPQGRRGDHRRPLQAAAVRRRKQPPCAAGMNEDRRRTRKPDTGTVVPADAAWPMDPNAQRAAGTAPGSLRVGRQ